MNNIITIAVLENRPELITSHPDFNINELKEDGCGLNMFGSSVCNMLDCSNCPFDMCDSSKTLESMKQWLKIEPLEQSTQPITYSEEEVKNLLEKYRNYAEIHGLKERTKKLWFKNNKKK